MLLFAMRRVVFPCFQGNGNRIKRNCEQDIVDSPLPFLLTNYGKEAFAATVCGDQCLAITSCGRTIAETLHVLIRVRALLDRHKPMTEVFASSFVAATIVPYML